MTRIPVIIDCDPGVDDAIALLLAFAASDALEILAVTTTAGNVDGAQTARNACLIRQIAGREDVPVHAGAEVPLMRAPIGASHFHGDSGIGDLPLFEPAAPPAPGHGVEAMVDLVMGRPAGTVRLAVTGPMTNLALALRREPRLAAHLGPVVAMGGARAEGGNMTASDLTRGHTAVEFRLSEAHPANARWAVRADAEGVFALIQDRLARR